MSATRPAARSCRRTISMLVGLAAAAGFSGTSVHASALREPATAPTELTTVTDDTSTMSISVPTGWTLDTAPQPFWGFYDAVRPGMYPTIKAITAAATETFVSSLLMQAVPVGDHASVIESFYGDYGVDCPDANFTRTSFETATLTGTRLDSGQCYDVIARHTIVAEYGADLMVVIDFQATTAADDALFPQILDSLTINSTTLPPIGLPASFFEYGAFDNMPQLGSEPVLGTGCGANGSLGEQIPDGWWAGYAHIEPTGDDVNIGIDVACVYYGQSAQQVLAQGNATVISSDPDFLVVNNNDRVRTMPAAENFSYYVGEQLPDACIPGSPGDQFTDQSLLAWIHIGNGQVDYVFYDCTGDAVPTPVSAP